MTPNPYCNGDPRDSPEGTEVQALDDRASSGSSDTTWEDAPAELEAAIENGVH